jgi:hypothetical protein
VGMVPDPQVVSDLSVWLEGDHIRTACGAIPEGYVRPDAAFLSTVAGITEQPEPEVVPEPLPAPVPSPGPERRGPFGNLFGNRDPQEAPRPDHDLHRDLRRGLRRGPGLDPAEDMLIEDRLHVSTLEAVQASFERRRMSRDLQATVPDLYSSEVLYWHQDFRTLMAIRYVASLAEDYGVQTEIREVLSMPLGASEITLEEATSLYSGLVSGSAYEFVGETRSGDEAPLLTSTSLIHEIRDMDGRVLYKANPKITTVADPAVAEMTADILRNVVLHGTGRRAASAVPHGSYPVPLGGKTGTTNDFRNAAFIGYVPVGNPHGYSIQGGFTIGAYVGYDDNRSMSNKRIKLAGASGALPAWIGTAHGLMSSGLLYEPPLAQEGTPERGWPLMTSSSLVRVPVDDKTGLQTVAGAGTTPTSTTLVRGGAAVAEVDLPRLARPARISPGTIEALPEEERARVPAPSIPELESPEHMSPEHMSPGIEDPGAQEGAEEELPIIPDGM